MSVRTRGFLKAGLVALALTALAPALEAATAVGLGQAETRAEQAGTSLSG